MEQHATLPVKWMPLESLMDGYFDEKTDVVSEMHYLYAYSMYVRTYMCALALLMHISHLRAYNLQMLYLLVETLNLEIILFLTFSVLNSLNLLALYAVAT